MTDPRSPAAHYWRHIGPVETVGALEAQTLAEAVREADALLAGRGGIAVVRVWRADAWEAVAAWDVPERPRGMTDCAHAVTTGQPAACCRGCDASACRVPEVAGRLRRRWRARIRWARSWRPERLFVAWSVAVDMDRRRAA